MKFTLVRQEALATLGRTSHTEYRDTTRAVLAQLSVRNVVLIERLELALAPGFNVVTGETGAGKSMLVDALSLVLGGRARPALVRSGADEAEVEALF